MLYGISRPWAVQVMADEAYTFTYGRDRRSLAKARISGLQLGVPELAIRGASFESRAEAGCNESQVVTPEPRGNIPCASVSFL